MSRFQLLSDAQWALIADLLPARTGKRGGPFQDARSMVEGAGDVRGVLMSAGDRRVHRHCPVDDTGRLCSGQQLGHDHVPGAVSTHAPMPGPDALPGPERIGNIAPGDPTPVPIDDHTGGWVELQESPGRAA